MSSFSHQSPRYLDVLRLIEVERAGLIDRSRSVLKMREAFSRLNLVFPAGGKGITLVAGTNGKGTVAKTLEVLTAHVNPKVGIFTSPHLMETTERIRSHGRDLTPLEFVEIFEHVAPVARSLELGHFEILTLMACEAFFGDRTLPRVDHAVIEVGVGGRRDPTRAIPHDTSVITRLGMDHVEMLGGTLESIAREKAGIVDSGNLVVYAPLPERGCDLDALKVSTEARDAVWFEAPCLDYEVVERNGEPIWRLDTPWGRTEIAMLGRRAVENVSIALRVMELKNHDMPTVLEALPMVKWPGRMERFDLHGRRVFLSGDHNPQGMASLDDILEHLRFDDLHLLIGFAKNKPAPEMLERLSRLPRVKMHFTLTPFRSGDLSNYGQWLGDSSATDPDPVLALGKTLDLAGPEDLVLVTGSLYLVGRLRKAIVNGEL